MRKRFETKAGVTPIGTMSATYSGKDERLRGKRALLTCEDAARGMLKAQFDDVNLPEAFGWHNFSIFDFDITMSDATALRKAYPL